MKDFPTEQLNLLLSLILREKGTICGDVEYAELCSLQRKIEEELANR